LIIIFRAEILWMMIPIGGICSLGYLGKKIVTSWKNRSKRKEMKYGIFDDSKYQRLIRK